MNNPLDCPSCNPCNQFTIYQGDDVYQVLQVVLNGDPVDLSGTGTNVSICLINADGTDLTLTLLGSGLVAVDLAHGKFAIQLTEVQSAALMIQQSADMDAVVTIAAKKQTYRFANSLNVLARSC